MILLKIPYKREILMKKQSIKRKIIFVVSLILACSTVMAHSGRTDGNGGHKDNKNKSGLGSYHYHCGGYPAHLHTGGECPYKSSSILTPSSKASSLNKNNDTIKTTYTAKSKTFLIDNETCTIETIIVNDTNLVELKSLCEQLGISIKYDADTKSVTGSKDDIEFTLQIDSTNFWKGSELTTLTTAPVVYNGRTMIPARVVAETIGKAVTYDAANDCIIIN